MVDWGYSQTCQGSILSAEKFMFLALKYPPLNVNLLAVNILLVVISTLEYREARTQGRTSTFAEDVDETISVSKLRHPAGGSHVRFLGFENPPSRLERRDRAPVLYTPQIFTVRPHSHSWGRSRINIEFRKPGYSQVGYLSQG